MKEKMLKGKLELTAAKKRLAEARKLSKEKFEGSDYLASINRALRDVAFWDGYLSCLEEIKEEKLEK